MHLGDQEHFVNGEREHLAAACAALVRFADDLVVQSLSEFVPKGTELLFDEHREAANGAEVRIQHQH